MYPTPNRSSSEVDKGNQDTNLLSGIILQRSSCRVLTKVVCGLGGLRVFQIPETKYHILVCTAYGQAKNIKNPESVKDLVGFLKEMTKKRMGEICFCFLHKIDYSALYDC